MVHVDKPSWVSHGGQPIFSIDVHPDGSRFATAGQDHQVKLWALKPVVNIEAERDESEPQLLATLGGHLGAVNCVRWSVDGVLLASGSDDHLVMIWRQAAAGEAAGSAPFGSRAPPPTERWRCVLTLSGHTGDVVDVSWSPAGHRLASVSLDNSVRIWSVECAIAGGARLGGPHQLITSLDGHCGMVKGVAWDPIGRYVASQGDDKAVLVWNARDWTQSARVEEPFTRTSQKTLFRRLRWSPDGQFLCAPHAYKKPAHIAAVLRRPTGVDTSAWTPEVDFVGHKSPVVVAAFSPRIFTRSDVDGTGPAAGRAAYCVCALGGQDCVVSVWLTCKAKAACVVHGLFTEDVLDLSWASDGATLLACSMDGSVACVRLEQHEIGSPLPHAEQADRLASLYGHDHGTGGGETSSPAPLPHSAQMLLLEAASPARSVGRGLAAAAPVQPPVQRPAEPSSPVHAGQAPLPATPPADAAHRRAGACSLGGWAGPDFSPEQVIRLQRETKTKDGRRRITPVAVDLPVLDVPAPAPPPPAAQHALLSAPLAAPAFAAAAAPLALHNDGVVAPAEACAPSLRLLAAAPPPPAAAPAAIGSRPAVRPAPVGVTPVPAPPGGLGPQVPLAAGAAKRQRVVAPRGAAEPAGATLPATPDAAPVPVSRPLLPPAALPPSQRVTMCIPAAAQATRAPFAGPGAGGLGPISRGFGGAVVLEAVAGGAAGPGDGGTLRCSQGGELVWSAALTSRAVLLAAGAGWSAAACLDGSVVILTPAGRRAAPALHAVESASWLHADGDALLLVGSGGEVRVWRGLPGAVACAVCASAAAILGGRGERLHRASLLPDGSPLLCLTNGTYAWRHNLAAWLPLDDTSFVGSEYASGFVGPDGAPAVPAPDGGPAGVASRLAGMPLERQRLLTAAHIEHRMAAAAELGAAQDYTEWARLYARHLALPPADVRKVRELCDDLLGPLDETICTPHTARPGGSAPPQPRQGGWAGGEPDGGAGLGGGRGMPPGCARTGWSPMVAGVRKLDLLQETVLPALATNRHLQRILAEYLEMLHAIRHT